MKKPDPQHQPGTTQKLQKVLAQAGLGSRRQMEELILAGRVTVNGIPAQLGMRVHPRDIVKVAGRVLRGKSRPSPRVLLYHKPEGEIVSRDDPRGRPSVFDRLPPLRGERWIAVGRLDFNSCGLLVFTTSGELAERMMHPRYGLEREYAVRILGRVTPADMQRLLSGVALEDGQARVESIEEQGGEGANRWYRVVVKEGRKRLVRRLFEALGLTVSRLMRVRFGPLGLPPRLRRGQFMVLAPRETRRLLSALGLAPERQIERHESRQRRQERRPRR
ncbi:MAG TPA: pseudouridine synthase [Burkholderiales bacterium]|nr:pseudouridine synthase [Burkholderiales bacterium]